MQNTKTTNYYDTFIAVAEDCPVKVAEIPPQKDGKTTAASLQYEMVAVHPYRYTSDEVLFQVYAVKNEIPQSARAAEREKFFAKGQPCLRSSPLTKRYGWGVHSNRDGRIAIYAVESDEYARLANDKNLKHLKAMRSKRG